MFDSLSVLNLGSNRLSGIILDTFLSNCSLKTLDLSNNTLEGSGTKTTGSSHFPSRHSEDETVDGKYISFALGSSLCFGIVTWLLLHSTR
ncbi:hypothetical protein H5410_052901 [Solanum commersonii]|uniref:Uncharacterized protein n=1 Tax=Solanum commersonii TaxID=4109 RepID=A0A9J5X2U2_SOLCO|nr:hypothetical protein H5410_052901 [Solanum commersonii]